MNCMLIKKQFISSLRKNISKNVEIANMYLAKKQNLFILIQYKTLDNLFRFACLR